MTQRTIEEVEKDMQNVMSKCATWLRSTDGSHGACLYHNGMGKLEKELEELKELARGENDQSNKI